MADALGLVEIMSWSAAMAALDAAEKAAPIRLIQAELNDLYGVCLKFTGSAADVSAAVSAASDVASLMHVTVVTDVIRSPAAGSNRAYTSGPEFSPLIEQNVVFFPQESPVSEQVPYAIGFIETQGLTAVIEAIDTACKTANVEIIGKEKLGGGYVTVIIKGDTAAVKTAVETGKAKVEGLGKLIAAHVIPRPSSAVMSLLPK